MPPNKTLKVIRTEPGPSTGDTIIIDENGDRWIKRYAGYSTSTDGTGDRVAILEDGIIKEG